MACLVPWAGFRVIRMRSIHSRSRADLGPPLLLSIGTLQQHGRLRAPGQQKDSDLGIPGTGIGDGDDERRDGRVERSVAEKPIKARPHASTFR